MTTDRRRPWDDSVVASIVAIWLTCLELLVYNCRFDSVERVLSEGEGAVLCRAPSLPFGEAIF
jgi:hypothetical protein